MPLSESELAYRLRQAGITLEEVATKTIGAMLRHNGIGKVTAEAILERAGRHTELAEWRQDQERARLEKRPYRKRQTKSRP